MEEAVVNVGAAFVPHAQPAEPVQPRQRDAAGIRKEMMLRARLAAIRRIRAGVVPPFFAGTLLESRAARDQSSWPASPNASSSTWWSAYHTPASCQSRSRRQQVMPLPQPISCGSISHGMPLFRTKMIPVRQARSGTRGWPPLGLGRSGGRSGSITAQSSSLTNGFDCFDCTHTYASYNANNLHAGRAPAIDKPTWPRARFC